MRKKKGKKETEGLGSEWMWGMGGSLECRLDANDAAEDSIASETSSGLERSCQAT